MEWAKAELKKVQSKKTESMSSSQVQFSEGTYHAFDLIVDAEGGPQRKSAVKAALNYVLACKHFHAQGHSVGGRPWCEYNLMTQRWEFLYIKKGFREGFEKLWRLETSYADEPREVAVRSTSQPRAPNTKVERSTPSKRDRDAKSEGGTPSTRDRSGGTEDDPVKKAKKDMEGRFKLQ